MSSEVLTGNQNRLKGIKKEFPIFSNHPELVFLDNASTTQKPHAVIDTVSEYYSEYASNVHRGIYKIGERATDAYESVRVKAAHWIGSKDAHSIIFTRGTTESINFIANAYGSQNIKCGDEILISEMEHHSNIVPWQLLCERTGAVLKYIPITETGELDLTVLEILLTEKTKIVSIIQQSNVFGTINPVKEIIKKAHAVGAITVVDGAQSVPHIPVNVQDLDCDFLAFSGHKMLGPTGVGVLYGKPELLESMPPFMGGGEMIRTVTMEKSTWNDIPWRFEAGTPNIAQVIGLGTAIDFLDKIGIDNIRKHEIELLEYGSSILNSVNGIKLYGPSENRGAIFSFTMDKVHPHDLAQILDDENIAVRAGHHCAQPIMKKLGVPATIRASLYIYNSTEDIDALAHGLDKAESFFNYS